MVNCRQAGDARWAVLYVDRALTAPERLRTVGMINAPHPDKRTAMLVDFHTGESPAAAPPEWLPLPVQDNHPALGIQRQRLHSLLPADAAEDFHACRDYLVPDWDIGPQGDDIDLHRHRRDLLHGRVTAFGQRLQLAISAETALTGKPSLLGDQYRALLHRFSLLRDAVSRLALENHRFNAEDRRVRHWAREQAAQVRAADGLPAAGSPRAGRAVGGAERQPAVYPPAPAPAGHRPGP